MKKSVYRAVWLPYLPAGTEMGLAALHEVVRSSASHYDMALLTMTWGEGGRVRDRSGKHASEALRVRTCSG
jgi:hypothetical protein